MALDVTKDVTKDVYAKLTKRQQEVIAAIRQNPFVTIEEMSMNIGVSSRTIKRDIGYLTSVKIIRREGGPKQGKWVVLEF